MSSTQRAFGVCAEEKIDFSLSSVTFEKAVPVFTG
jgi:hypothetical protein